MDMKQIAVIFLSVLFLLNSCKKESEELSAVNVHGVWLGTWHTDDNLMHGSFLTPADQQNKRIDGEIFIRFGYPSGDGYSPDYVGNVDGDEVRVSMNISGVTITGEGKVTDEKEVTGRFYVSDNIQGSFSGTKYPLMNTHTEEVYVIERSESWHRSLFAVDDKLWISNMSEDKFEIISKSGEKIETRDDDFVRMNPAAFGGSYFWVYGTDYELGEEKIYKYTINGDRIDGFVIDKFWPDGLCYDNNTIFCSYSYDRKIYSYNEQGVLTDSTTIDFLYVNSFLRYEEGFLVAGYNSPYLFHMDSNGSLIKAYQIEENIISLARTSNGEIFCLTEEVIFGDDPITYTYKVLFMDI